MIDLWSFFRTPISIQKTVLFSAKQINSTSYIEGFNGDGYISFDDLRNVMLNLGENLSDKELQEMMNLGMPDDNGQISYKNFLQIVQKSWWSTSFQLGILFSHLIYYKTLKVIVLTLLCLVP